MRSVLKTTYLICGSDFIKSLNKKKKLLTRLKGVKYNTQKFSEKLCCLLLPIRSVYKCIIFFLWYLKPCDVYWFCWRTLINYLSQNSHSYRLNKLNSLFEGISIVLSVSRLHISSIKKIPAHTFESESKPISKKKNIFTKKWICIAYLC